MKLRRALAEILVGVVLGALVGGALVWSLPSAQAAHHHPQQVVQQVDRGHKDGNYRMSWYRGGSGYCGHTLRGHYVATNWWPCGTHLTVQYHHRTTHVVVQDRMGACPKHGCHCVDVAPGVFGALGLSTGHGVYHVRVTKVHRR